jgi:hypothetical protein
MQVTALDRDCRHGGGSNRLFQFVASCPGRAVSPDRKLVIARAGGDEAKVELRDASGHVLDDIAALDDGMPFVVGWAPNSRWFFVNHYLGSSLDRLRVYQVVNRVAIERSSALAYATRMAVSRYPCLGRTATVVASAWQWSRDSRRIAMVVYARPDACLAEGKSGKFSQKGSWEVLWMIADAETGRIDPASVRVRKNGLGPMPKDGPYAGL